MSDVQIGLLALGVAVVALVYGFNVYQEWRFRKKTRDAFARSHPDVLLDVPRSQVRDGMAGVRMEPVLAGEAPPAAPVAPMAVPRAVVREAELDIEEPESEPETDVAPLNAADRQALVSALLDPSLDFIAEVLFAEPHELPAVPRFNVAKRVQLLGRTEHGLWQPAEALPGVRYKQLNIGLQLVDRSGPVTEPELASFCQQVSRYAEGLGARTSFPQHQQKLVAARELDRFCGDVDVVIGINVVPRAPIAGKRLRSVVETAGLQLEPDGVFHFLADSGNTLYSLVNANEQPFTLHSLADGQFGALTLLFDVPRVAGGVEVYDRAVEFALQLADEFDAQLVDDNSRPLSSTSLARIREQLTHIYGTMDDRGIAPGSMAALRLFA